ncbi:ABC transporter ATP-binding protein [Pelagibius litoralis]|uniref:ABC transporter ATP-binding protein n=1 Tax=Pelagibius litoralis TaxID=374515 RepID=A0A967K7S7_9PROT|nr:ABC transporter ATP-binding protein [Pelagibius litoralis]NIA70018.1 ABC transporter ATP-binding protein [Pelagibius litoralis]
MLTIEKIHSYYGQAHILSDVSLSLSPGEIVVLIGRNGAGKSTTIKSIMGMVKVTQGSIRFGGDELFGEPPYRIARRGIGYVPEERRVFARLTIQENLEAGRQPPRDGAPRWQVDDLFDLFPNLAEARHRAAGTLSGGEQQMLTIARTLMGNPGCILLDEPSEGLAPVVVEQIIKVIQQIKGQSLPILLSEQNLYFASLVSDRAYVIETGRIRFSGTMRELEENAEIRQQYLAV